MHCVTKHIHRVVELRDVSRIDKIEMFTSHVLLRFATIAKCHDVHVSKRHTSLVSVIRHVGRSKSRLPRSSNGEVELDGKEKHKASVRPRIRPQQPSHSVHARGSSEPEVVSDELKTPKYPLPIMQKFWQVTLEQQDRNPRLGVLYKPHESSDLDQQHLHQVLSLCRQSRALAARGELRPYANPMHGFTLLVWLQEYLQYRKDQYTMTTRATLIVLEHAHLSVMDVSYRFPRRLHQGRRTRSLLWNVKHLIKETTEHMRTFQTVLLESDVIVTRNSLYTHARVGTERWKVHCHAVLDAMNAVYELLRDNKLPLFSKLDVVRRLTTDETAWMLNVKAIKKLLVRIQERNIQQQDPALYELQRLRSTTHRYWRTSSKVTSIAGSIANHYLSAIRDGHDVIEQAYHFERTIKKVFANPAKQDAEISVNCLHFLRATRLSVKYNYQQWPEDAPVPVLPDFVQDAIDVHRQRRGPSSIF